VDAAYRLKLWAHEKLLYMGGSELLSPVADDQIPGKLQSLNEFFTGKLRRLKPTQPDGLSSTLSGQI
jgi:hypothetical protein